jgi:hypothetical protein
LTKFLKDLDEDTEVVEVSKVDELVEDGQLGIIIVMSRDISLEIVPFQDILGVHTVESTPMPSRIVPS